MEEIDEGDKESQGKRIKQEERTKVVTVINYCWNFPMFIA
jgi:hypothetical protein